jgi:hypothetical protein
VIPQWTEFLTELSYVVELADCSPTFLWWFSLVDLAGSERSSETESGPRLRETQCVDASLSALGKVMLALAEVRRWCCLRSDVCLFETLAVCIHRAYMHECTKAYK